MDPAAILAKTRKNITDVDSSIQTLVNSLRADHLVDEVKPPRQQQNHNVNKSDKPMHRTTTLSFDERITEHESFLVPCFQDCIFGVTLENNTTKMLETPQVVMTVLQSEVQNVLYRPFTYKYRVLHLEEAGASSSRIPAGDRKEDVIDIEPKEKFKVIVSCTNPQLLKKNAVNPKLLVNLLVSGKSIWKRVISMEDCVTGGNQLDHLKDINQVKSSFVKEIVVTSQRQMQTGQLLHRFLEHKLKLVQVSRVQATFDVHISFYVTQENGLHSGCLVRLVTNAREHGRIMLSFHTRTSDQMRLLQIEIHEWLNEQLDLKSCPVTEETGDKLKEWLSTTLAGELKLLMQLMFLQQNGVVSSDINSVIRSNEGLQTKAMVSNWLKSYVAAAERSDSAFMTRNSDQSS